MFGSLAGLTRRGHVLRALAAAGIIGAAACQDADRAVGPAQAVARPSAAFFFGGAYPDLIVKSLTYSPSDPNFPGVTWSADVQLTAVVRNAGLATAGASILTFSGWAPATLLPLYPALSISSPCSLPLQNGQFWVPALGPGQEYAVAWTVHLADGQYHITATANSPQCTSESNLSNNAALVDLTVVMLR